MASNVLEMTYLKRFDAIFCLFSRRRGFFVEGRITESVVLVAAVLVKEAHLQPIYRPHNSQLLIYNYAKYAYNNISIILMYRPTSSFIVLLDS